MLWLEGTMTCDDMFFMSIFYQEWMHALESVWRQKCERLNKIYLMQLSIAW